MEEPAVLNIRLLLALSLIALTTACNVDGNITDLTSRRQENIYTQLTGIVPGAGIHTTAGSYQVESTIGDTLKGIRTTTSGGYTVYSNIQGNNISEGSYTHVE